MWPRRSHTLASLTRSTSIKRKFKWAQVEQETFNKINRIVTHDTLLTYPYFNETFKNHTDASTFKLGAVISHKVKPIGFYSRRLTDAQQWYKVTERELLSILETMKEFGKIILGHKLIIYTDHKHITF